MGEVCICGTLAQGAAGVFLRATLGWFGGSGGGVCFLESDLVRWEGLDFGTGFKPLSHMLLDLLFAVWQGERVVSLLCLVLCNCGFCFVVNRNRCGMFGCVSTPQRSSSSMPKLHTRYVVERSAHRSTEMYTCYMSNLATGHGCILITTLHEKVTVDKIFTYLDTLSHVVLVLCEGSLISRVSRNL